MAKKKGKPRIPDRQPERVVKLRESDVVMFAGGPTRHMKVHGSKAAKSSTRFLHRDSKTGRIVTKDYADKHPTTTQKERTKAPPRRKK